VIHWNSSGYAVLTLWLENPLILGTAAENFLPFFEPGDENFHSLKGKWNFGL